MRSIKVTRKFGDLLNIMHFINTEIPVETAVELIKGCTDAKSLEETLLLYLSNKAEFVVTHIEAGNALVKYAEEHMEEFYDGSILNISNIQVEQDETVG